ncbi:hypothetical protein CN367_00785 [Priestia megaterium]|nr:hypothetical protein CN367_00785 [Priestia megaterium]PFL58945.1 hypothetical protein COJ36_29695 [Priestia megaterium]
MLILLLLKKIDELAKKSNQSRQQFLKKLVYALAIFSQQSGRGEHLKNLIRANIRMMELFAISMENPHDMLKEIIREYDDDE